MPTPAKPSPWVGIRNSTDYSPFGVELDGRTVSVDGYRFGYQGSEKDNEFKGEGNSYTTEFRQLDPRLGRWLSVDPLFAKFSWQSPYVSMDNNTLSFFDVFGLSAEGDPSKKDVNIIMTTEQQTYDELIDTKQSNWIIMKVTDMKDAYNQLDEYCRNNNTTIANLSFVHHGNNYKSFGNTDAIVHSVWLELYNENYASITANGMPDNFQEQMIKSIMARGGSEAQAEAMIYLSKSLSLIKNGGNYLSIACDEADDIRTLTAMGKMANNSVNIYMNTNRTIITKKSTYTVNGIRQGEWGSIFNDNLTTLANFKDKQGWIMYNCSTNALVVTNKSMVIKGVGTAFELVPSTLEQNNNEGLVNSKSFNIWYSKKYGSNALKQFLDNKNN